MNTNQETEWAAKIAGLLDEGTRDLDAKTTARLLEARKEALAHYEAKRAHTWAPAWASETVGRITEPFSNNLRAGLVVLALLGTVAAVIAWQSASPSQGSEIADLDQALLTDELPINAYLDKGFDSWLKR